MKSTTWFLLALICLATIAVSSAQTRPDDQAGRDQQGRGQTGRNASEGVLPPQAYITDRDDSSLKRQLQRLEDAEANMGELHPQLPSVRKRIAELKAELEAFHAIPNPFQRFEEQGVGPQQIVDRLSEKELRVLVVRLAVDVKDLRSRVADLEKALKIKNSMR